MPTSYQQVPTMDSDPPPSSLSSGASHTTLSTSTQSDVRLHNPRQQRDPQDVILEETFAESLYNDDDDRPLLPPANRTTPPVPNDGVFSNMSAKPERESAKLEDVPPAYSEAAADAVPPYWHTAVVAPGSASDLILIEGMPAGNMLNFAWNLLVSASFQFVGFMLTYLFHTTHAAKNGSRGGLGITLVQFGFYIRSRDDEHPGPGGDDNDDDGMNADIVAYFLMTLGWFIIIRSAADYVRVKQMEKIIATEPSVENIV